MAHNTNERVTFRLPERILSDVDGLVDAGVYSSRSEAIRAGLRGLDGVAEPVTEDGRRVLADGGTEDGQRIPATLRDDHTPDVLETETCDGADGHQCVRSDSRLTRGEDEIHVTTYGAGSDRSGERRVLCSDCRAKQNAVQLAEMPDMVALYSDEELSELTERFPDILADVEVDG